MAIDELFVEIQGSVDKGAKQIEDYAKNVDKTFGKLAISAQSVTKTTEALERRIKSTARELNVFDKIVLRTNTLLNNTGRAADYAMDVVGTFTKAIAESGKILLGFGLIGSRVFKALNIERYKQFRNYMIGLGVSTVKTTGAVSKLGVGMLRLMPLWLRWALGIGAVVLAYKTLRWAVTKAKESFNELNVVLEEKTQSLMLMHKGTLIELTKEYDKTVIELSASQTAMLRDYDDAVQWFKTTSEELTLWWDLHSPWQHIKRKSKIAFADIGEAIRHFFAEIPKTARKMHALQELVADPGSTALTLKYLDLLPEKAKIVKNGIISLFDAIVAGKNKVLVLIETAKEAKAAWLDTVEKIREASTTTINQIVNRFGPLRELIAYLESGGEGAINSVDDLKEKLDNLGLTLDDITLLSAAMQGIKMSPEQELSLNRLLFMIREIIRLSKDKGLIKVIDLPEERPITPVGPPPGEEEVSLFGNMLEVNAAIANLMQAAAAWSNAAEDIENASEFSKGAAILMQLAAVATAAAALATVFSAEALAVATFNWAGVAVIIGFIAAIASLAASIAAFEKGGFVSKGPGSLPEIPSAAEGMITPPNVPDSGMLVNVHRNEFIGDAEYFGRLMGFFAQRFLESRPTPALAGARSGGNVTIAIQANKDFNSPSWWENLVQTSIRPALRNVNYGR